MIKDMYRFHPKLNLFSEIYIYGDNQMAGQIKKDLEKQGIGEIAYLKDNHSQSLTNAAVILCDISSKALALLEKTKAHTVFIHRFLYQKEVRLTAWTKEIACKTLFLGMPELYERENIIFSVGEDGHRLFMETLNIGIYITAFCDSDPKYQGMRLLNKPILSLDELCQKHKNSNILIGSRQYLEEISRQLEDSGFAQIYRWR